MFYKVSTALYEGRQVGLLRAAFLKNVISSSKTFLLKVKVHGVFLNRILFAFITHLRLNVADIGREGYRINSVCYPKTLFKGRYLFYRVPAALYEGIKNVLSSLKNISRGVCFMSFGSQGYNILLKNMLVRCGLSRCGRRQLIGSVKTFERRGMA